MDQRLTLLLAACLSIHDRAASESMIRRQAIDDKAIDSWRLVWITLLKSEDEEAIMSGASSSRLHRWYQELERKKKKRKDNQTRVPDDVLLTADEWNRPSSG